MDRSFVVTGGGRGVGAAVARRLAHEGFVVLLEAEAAATGWTRGEARIEAVVGDAGDSGATEAAADAAEARAPLAGWVNNAAVFRDAALHDAGPRAVLELVSLNLGLALTGAATAVRRLVAAGRPGAIVNVSSHQAQRAVPGALPYATAKAAIEGLTRALAVDYGPAGIRTNAVALGSVDTGRIEPSHADALRRLHPLGRVGTGEEVAAVVAHLLSDAAAFVNGAVVPVDGGRAALGLDPEASDVRA